MSDFLAPLAHPLTPTTARYVIHIAQTFVEQTMKMYHALQQSKHGRADSQILVRVAAMQEKGARARRPFDEAERILDADKHAVHHSADHSEALRNALEEVRLLVTRRNPTAASPNPLAELIALFDGTRSLRLTGSSDYLLICYSATTGLLKNFFGGMVSRMASFPTPSLLLPAAHADWDHLTNWEKMQVRPTCDALPPSRHRRCGSSAISPVGLSVLRPAHAFALVVDVMFLSSSGVP